MKIIHNFHLAQIQLEVQFDNTLILIITNKNKYYYFNHNFYSILIQFLTPQNQIITIHKNSGFKILQEN